MESKAILIIPALNERKNLEKLIPAIFEFMPGISILVVDDDSQDGTDQYLRSLNNPNLFILSSKDNFGYGKACIDGFRWSLERQYESIVTMDADFSHDYRTIPGLLSGLENNDVVIGSRYIKNGKIENWKWHRRILSKFANFYVRFILGLKIKDITTGFNAYKKDALLKSDFNRVRSDGYAFLVELKYRLHKAGVKITEYPITFYERREGQSKMSSKVIWESVKLPWKLRLGK